MNNDDEASSSCFSSSTSSPNSTQRVSKKLQKPKVRLGIAQRSIGERQAEALALSLGTSFAFYTNMLLKRKSVADQNVYADDLGVISASVLKESLANVYSNKLRSFESTFERSFNSHFKIFNLTDESAFPHKLDNNNVGNYNKDRSTTCGCSDSEPIGKETSSATLAYEVIQGGARTTSLMNEIVLHEENRQLSCVPRSSEMSTIQQFLDRAKYLKNMEICLAMKKLELKEIERAETKELKSKEVRLKEKELAQTKDLKRMEIRLKKKELVQTKDLKSKEMRLKKRELAQKKDLKNKEMRLKEKGLEMGKSKLEMDTSDFKTKQADRRKGEMVTQIMDWLVVSVIIMSASTLYGAYVFSQQRIMEGTSICAPSMEKMSSWWVPEQVSSITTEINILICRISVWVQSLFGVLLILFVTCFIFKRSPGAKQTMPLYVGLFLGLGCGLAGMFCVDTLGGSGYTWLIFWVIFCTLQLLANLWTLPLYGLIVGSVPCWARYLLYGVILLVLPVINGLYPFATFGEWSDHFAVVLSRSSSHL